MAVKRQERRDTSANWTSNNPTLSSGEIGFETNTGAFKIGDGSTAWTSLKYANATGTLTTQGDMLYASSANTPARLAKGTAGQMLRINTGATAPEWVDSVIDNNYIIDGNFQVAQTNPTVGTEITNPATGTYPVFDMFKYANSGFTPPSNIKLSQQLITSGDVPGSKYCYRINVDGAGTSIGSSAVNYSIQFIENGTQNLAGAGKKITVSFYARSTIANKRIGINIFQNYGTGGSPSSDEVINGTNFTLTSTWTKYTYTFTTNTLVGKTFGTNNNDYIAFDIWNVWGSTYKTLVGSSTDESFVGSGVIEVTQVKLESGDTPTVFVPRPYAEELRRCQRYFYVPGLNTLPGATPVYGDRFGSTVYASGGIIQIKFPLPVSMRIISNVTFVGSRGTTYNIVTQEDAVVSDGTFSSSLRTFNEGYFRVDGATLVAGKWYHMSLLNQNTPVIKIDARF